MKILLDENIPAAQRLFGRLGQVQTISGRSIRRADLMQVDALIVRSVTKVGKALLVDTPVKFVGSATAGTDHINQQELQQLGIAFAAAPGCNAVAVTEYVLSCILSLAQQQHFYLRDKVVGIIGVGEVGRRLQARLTALGVTTLRCDPPRQDCGDGGPFYSLQELLAQADILTLHTPLTHQGKEATYHLIDDEVLAALPDNRIVINAARGAVINNQSLLKALKKGKPLTVVLDVWENEPNISLPLLDHIAIATPHIAGYSLEGKLKGTLQIYQAFCRFLGYQDAIALSDLVPQSPVNPFYLTEKLTEEVLNRLAHLVYDVRHDDSNLRRLACQSGGFDALRRDYQERREWSSLPIFSADKQHDRLFSELGFTMSQQN